MFLVEYCLRNVVQAVFQKIPVIGKVLPTNLQPIFGFFRLIFVGRILGRVFGVVLCETFGLFVRSLFFGFTFPDVLLLCRFVRTEMLKKDNLEN